jgi:hypothetical protein
VLELYWSVTLFVPVFTVWDVLWRLRVVPEQLVTQAWNV